MKLAVTGSRSWNDAERLRQCLESVMIEFGFDTLIHGNARGADSIAEKWAIENKVSMEVYSPDYSRFDGKVAPLRRNDQIVEACDILVAFWDGESKGTLYTFRKGMESGKNCIMCLSEEAQKNFGEVKKKLSVLFPNGEEMPFFRQ